MQSAFVTGSTGLLGNNLVRMLITRGIKVKALARSHDKAAHLFANLPVEIIQGDMTDVGRFAAAMRGCDALFHTAAFFRDNFKGGRHWDQLHSINVDATGRLLSAAYDSGIRRAVHTSSIAVLKGEPGQLIDETMERPADEPDDYYRSKILSDHKVFEILRQYPDMHIALVLPGWMFGPGDVGPTSSGQFVLDYMNRKLPGRVPGTFSVVDARDVAAVHISAMEKGRSGERYLAAGRHLAMDSLMPMLQQVTGVPAPARRVPLAMLRIIAEIYEVYASLSGKPILLSRATVKLMAKEEDRTHFDSSKSVKELGASFRPLESTLADVVAWYRNNGYLPPQSGASRPDSSPPLTAGHTNSGG